VPIPRPRDRPGKLLPKQLTTGEHFTSLKTWKCSG
jgi:hypothetical protein